MYHVIQHTNEAYKNKSMCGKLYLVEDILDNTRFQSIYHFSDITNRWVRCSYNFHPIWNKTEYRTIRTYNTIEEFIGDYFEDFI
jgi:hypothetical protein